MNVPDFNITPRNVSIPVPVLNRENETFNIPIPKYNREEKRVNLPEFYYNKENIPIPIPDYNKKPFPMEIPEFEYNYSHKNVLIPLPKYEEENFPVKLPQFNYYHENVLLPIPELRRNMVPVPIPEFNYNKKTIQCDVPEVEYRHKKYIIPIPIPKLKFVEKECNIEIQRNATNNNINIIITDQRNAEVNQQGNMITQNENTAQGFNNQGRQASSNDNNNSDNNRNINTQEDLTPEQLINDIKNANTKHEIKRVIEKWKNAELNENLFMNNHNRLKIPILNIIAFEKKWPGVGQFVCTQGDGAAFDNVLHLKNHEVKAHEKTFPGCTMLEFLNYLSLRENYWNQTNAQDQHQRYHKYLYFCFCPKCEYFSMNQG